MIENSSAKLNDTFSEAGREAKREYMRKWRANNRDKVKAIQARYWNKKAREAEPQSEQQQET